MNKFLIKTIATASILALSLTGCANKAPNGTSIPYIDLSGTKDMYSVNKTYIMKTDMDITGTNPLYILEKGFANIATKGLPTYNKNNFVSQTKYIRNSNNGEYSLMIPFTDFFTHKKGDNFFTYRKQAIIVDFKVFAEDNKIKEIYAKERTTCMKMSYKKLNGESYDYNIVFYNCNEDKDFMATRDEFMKNLTSTMLTEFSSRAKIENDYKALSDKRKAMGESQLDSMSKDIREYITRPENVQLFEAYESKNNKIYAVSTKEQKQACVKNNGEVIEKSERDDKKFRELAEAEGFSSLKAFENAVLSKRFNAMESGNYNTGNYYFPTITTFTCIERPKKDVIFLN